MMGFKMQAIVIGIIATAALDLWSLLLNRFANIPMANWGMVGRWFAHMLRGRFRHDSIAAAEPVPNEVAIGWLAHYLIGILFAAVLLALWPGWIRNPTLWPPMIVGWVTILAGLRPRARAEHRGAHGVRHRVVGRRAAPLAMNTMAATDIYNTKSIC